MGGVVVGCSSEGGRRTQEILVVAVDTQELEHLDSLYGLDGWLACLLAALLAGRRFQRGKERASERKG
jgi:hypothetical protein